MRKPNIVWVRLSQALKKRKLLPDNKALSYINPEKFRLASHCNYKQDIKAKLSKQVKYSDAAFISAVINILQSPKVEIGIRTECF